uniref:Uncharacterized protein n=1 Tax=Solanum tuberosum TaxID=4113 RepID=M1DTT2_SOLTU
MEPTPKLLAYRYVVPDPMFMPEHVNRSNVYDRTWQPIPCLCRNVATDPNCAAEHCSATLVEIADELGDPPFGQLISFSVLPLTSSHFGSLGGTILLRGTDRRLADCPFPRLLIHFLHGFAYWNEGRFMSFRRLAKLNSAIRRIPFLVLFSPICSVLRLKCPCFH